jgi:hypothetical protein
MKAPIVALFAATLLMGCVGNNTQSLVIMQNNVPDTSSGACVAPGEASALFRQSGLLDVSLIGGAGTSDQVVGYLMFPVVANNLHATAQGQSITIDPAAFNIQLKRVDVEVSDASSGRALMPKFSVPVFKVVEGGASTGLIVDVMPAGAVANLGDATMVIAKLAVIGERDGSDIRSNTMEYAIEVCDGCLLVDEGPCADISATGTINECNIAQDETAVCCEHSTLGRICPAQPETTTG